MVGHEENVGQGLVTPEAAAELETAFLETLVNQPPEELAEERDVLIMAYWAITKDPELSTTLEALTTPLVRRKLLTDSFTEVHSQGMGSRAVQKEPRLHWAMLEAVLGADEIAATVAEIRESGEATTDDEPRLALTERYLDGWRPED